MPPIDQLQLLRLAVDEKPLNERRDAKRTVLKFGSFSGFEISAIDDQFILRPDMIVEVI